jgi:hypothetical protein
MLDNLIESRKIFRAENEIHERYKNVKFFAIEQNDLKKYGYPYIGKNWLPHFSFCSVDNALKEKIMKEVNIDTFLGSYLIPSISVYILKNDKPYKIKTIELI